MIDANDPNRCQTSIPGGQCTKLAIPGTETCQTHTQRGPKDGLRCYLLTNHLLGEAAHRHSGVEHIKSLRDEIAVARAVIELRLNSLQTETELIAAAPSVFQMVLAIEKLVASCHAMEIKLGNLLDKAALITLAQKIITIIDTSLDDSIPGRDELVAEIAKQIVEAVALQENK